MTFRLGLTGSIGMGKSTTARMFEKHGCSVWDADEAVHRLYAPGGEAVSEIAKIWPDVIENGAVSRGRIRRKIAEDPEILPRLERIVHPLVARDRAKFAAHTKAPIAVFEVPLLFETGSEKEFDAVACVTVSPEIQKSRVLTRGTMTEQQLAAILARQMPIEEKVKRSDYVIETDTLEHAEDQVRAIVSQIKAQRDA